MKHALAFAILLVVALTVLASSGAEVGHAEQADQQRLDPSNSRGYLQSGERLAALANNSDELSSAQEVLAMGAVIAQRRGELSIAASCCIALAETERNRDRATDLWDLALMLDPARSSAWKTRRTGTSRASVRQGAAECLRLIRNAEYEDASEIFKREPVRAMIRSVSAQLGHDPEPMLERIRTLLRPSGKDSCRGRVFVTRVNDGVSAKELCRDHSHPIGVAPSMEMLRFMLSVELACIDDSDGPRGWAGATAMSLDRPTQLPSISLLASWYGIDASRPYKVNGRWVARP